MQENFYPLIFEPILRERIWGGYKLKSLLDKKIDSKFTGESWELSTIENSISIIKNGLFTGNSLDQIIKSYPKEILGKKVHELFGNNFPLLFKFIDAKEDLSIQVHPNDSLALKRHNSFGKTEMWFVIEAEESARIIIGFKKESSPEEYLNHVKNKDLIDILKEVPVKKGDVYFIETGTIHAIGAGIVIAEIQQTSDITYRIYDWDREDYEGNMRELHIDLALEAINYYPVNAKREYQSNQNTSNPIVNCNYFKTNFLPLDGNISFQTNSESFKVIMCTEGEFKIIFNNQKMGFKKGETILIPAILKNYQFQGKANLLEICI
jgi:mannose-6-phosphate isomerase